MRQISQSRPLRILLAAVEPSGDGLGSALLHSLKTLSPDAEYFGCGGPLMERQGFQSAFPIEPISVMGFTDVIRVLPLGLRRAKELALLASRKKADIAVFIDGWAFSRIGAKRMRRYSPNTAIYKLAAPQVWASRPKRVNFVRRYFDGVLTLLPFEPPYFEIEGVRATFVGNPNFQMAWTARGDGEAFRRRYGIERDAKVLAVLLGSRKSELKHLGPQFRETVRRLHERHSDLKILAPLATSTFNEARAALAGWSGRPLIVGEAEKYDAFAAADAALAVSGTATTELAINATPMIAAYRLDPLTAIWARRVMTAPYASILNIIAEREIIPEFIQERCRPAEMAEALDALLTDETARRAQLDAFAPLLDKLGVSGPSASQKAARTILSWATEDEDRVANRIGERSSAPVPE